MPLLWQPQRATICPLQRAKLGFAATTAQKISAIISNGDYATPATVPRDCLLAFPPLCFLSYICFLHAHISFVTTRFYERHGKTRVFLLFARFSVPYRASAKAVYVATELRSCTMPKATIGFCFSTAPIICAIISHRDKTPHDSFAKLSAWCGSLRSLFLGGGLILH